MKQNFKNVRTSTFLLIILDIILNFDHIRCVTLAFLMTLFSGAEMSQMSHFFLLIAIENCDSQW